VRPPPTPHRRSLPLPSRLQFAGCSAWPLNASPPPAPTHTLTHTHTHTHLHTHTHTHTHTSFGAGVTCVWLAGANLRAAGQEGSRSESDRCVHEAGRRRGKRCLEWAAAAVHFAFRTRGPVPAEVLSKSTHEVMHYYYPKRPDVCLAHSPPSRLSSSSTHRARRPPWCAQRRKSPARRAPRRP